MGLLFATKGSIIYKPNKQQDTYYLAVYLASKIHIILVFIWLVNVALFLPFKWRLH